MFQILSCFVVQAGHGRYLEGVPPARQGSGKAGGWIMLARETGIVALKKQFTILHTRGCDYLMARTGSEEMLFHTILVDGNTLRYTAFDMMKQPVDEVVIQENIP